MDNRQFFELVDRPGFGSAFHGSSTFRNLFQGLINRSEDDDIKKWRKKMSVEVDKNGQLVFHSRELHRTFRRNEDESFGEMLHRIMSGTSMDPTDPTRIVGLQGVRTSENITGRASARSFDQWAESDFQFGREYLGRIAHDNNLEIIYNTFESTGENLRAIDALRSPSKEKRDQLITQKLMKKGDTSQGWVQADGDTIKQLLMRDKATGEMYGSTQTLGFLGPNAKEMFGTGVVRKRMNMFLNGPDIQIQPAPGEIRRVLFDPQKVLSKNKYTEQTMLSYAHQRVARDKTLTFEKALDAVYADSVDGMMMVRESFFVEQAQKNRRDELGKAKGKLRQDRLDGTISTAEHNKANQALDRLGIAQDQLIDDIRRGRARANFRVGGRIDVKTGTDELAGGAGKGDPLITADHKFNTFLRKFKEYEDKTDEELSKINIVAPQGNNLKELGPLDNVKPFMTFGIVAREDESVYTSSLSMAGHGALMNPVNPATGRTFITESLEHNIQKGLNEIRSGKMGNFNKLLEDLIKIDPVTFDNPVEYQAALDAKRYAVRVKNFLDGGGNLASNDTMMKEAHRVLESHLFTVRRGKGGRKIQFGDQTIEDPALRVEQMNSTTGHMSIVDALTEDLNTIDDRLNLNFVIRPNVDGGFGIKPSDMVGYRAAYGGADLDDALNLNRFNYDPETKRMLAFMDRSPQYQGEYMWQDIQWATDKHFASKSIRMPDKKGRIRPQKVGQLQLEKEQILNKIKKHALADRKGKLVSKETAREVRDLMTRLNEINGHFDTFLRNFEGINFQKMSELYSMDAETQSFNRVHAPVGWRTTVEQGELYKRGSFFNSNSRFSAIRLSDISDTLNKIKEEFELGLGSKEKAPNPMLPYEFVGDDFNEMTTGPGGIGESELFGDFRQRHAGIITAAKQRQEDAKVSKLTDEAMRALNATAAERGGVLGRAVDAATLIRHTYEANTNLTAGAPSREHIAAFRAAVTDQHGKIYGAPGEIVIDALTKYGDEKVISEIEQQINEDLASLGRVLGKSGAGYDPLLAQQRSNKTNLRHIAAGYREATGLTVADMSDEAIDQKLSLPISDPRATIARSQKEHLAIREDMLKTMEEDQIKASEDLLERLKDIDVDPEARTAVNEFREEFYKGRSNLRKLVDSPEGIYDLLEQSADSAAEGTGVTNGLLSNLTDNQLNLNSMRRVENWGLEGEALHKRVLALAKVSAESRVAGDRSFAAMDPLMQVSTWEGVPGMNELYGEALKWNNERLLRDRMHQEASQFSETDTDISAYFDKHMEGLKKEYDVKEISNVAAYDQSRIRAAQKMQELGGTGYDEYIASVAKDMGFHVDDMTSDEIVDHAFSQSAETHIPPRLMQVGEGPKGMKRLVDRAATEEAASKVIESTTLRRFMGKGLPDELDKLLSLPGFRKGMGAAGIFAGLGMFHMLRGERTPEQAQGPPMLPGGSAYETMPRQELPMPATAAMSSSGFTYRVQAQGNFDSMALNNGLRNITGSNIHSTIYNNPSSGYNPAGSSTAIDVLNTLIGQ